MNKIYEKNNMLFLLLMRFLIQKNVYSHIELTLRKLKKDRIISVNMIVIAFLTFILTSCTARRGWVERDKKTNKGIYVYFDGSHYAGGFKDKKKNGIGTEFYDYREAYKSSYSWSQTPFVLHNSQLTTEFVEGDIKNNSQATFILKEGESPFTYVGTFANGGFEGKGIITFNDGRIFEGLFSNEKTLYEWMDVTRDMGPSHYWATNNMIGSKFSGYGIMKWPNGISFEGIAYDYYVFPRAAMDYYIRCDHSRFYGIGTLTMPGNGKYTGLIGESEDHKTVGPVNERNFKSYFNGINECGEKLLSECNKANAHQAKMIDEMIQSKNKADAWLNKEITNMANKMKSEPSVIDAIIRGSSAEEEEAKAKRLAEFNAIVDQNSSSSSSTGNSSESNSYDRKSSSGSHSSKNESNANNANSGADSNNSTTPKIQKKRRFHEILGSDFLDNDSESKACQNVKEIAAELVRNLDGGKLISLTVCNCRETTKNERDYNPKKPHFYCEATAYIEINDYSFGPNQTPDDYKGGK